jgi:hypothetical protein
MDGEGKIISLPKDAIFRAIDNEMVILHLQSGNYYSMNHVGKRIFELVQSGICAVNEIIELIASEYQVDKEVVKRDIEEVLTNLLHEHLIELRIDLKKTTQNQQEQFGKLPK